jgi:hypothetical protein
LTSPFGIGDSCLGRKPEFGADYRHARPRRKPGFDVQLPGKRRLPDIPAPTGIA